MYLFNGRFFERETVNLLFVGQTALRSGHSSTLARIVRYIVSTTTMPA